MIYKGLFWAIDDNLFCKKLSCDKNGNLLESSEYLTAKNGKTDNHERIWSTLPRHITNGKSFDFYPRGRVEIKNGRATVFLSPYICTDDTVAKVIKEFNLAECEKIRVNADGSFHYRCRYDYNE